MWLVVVGALGCVQVVSPTTSVDAGGDMESLDDVGPVCAAPRVLCGGACVDLQTDRAHCGRCGAACASGQSCVAGACRVNCASGQSSCAGVCRDLSNDLGNCGACGRACATGQVCTGGACQVVCGAGLTRCGGVCRDLTADTNHCGACGRQCATGQFCSTGACTSAADARQRSCEGTPTARGCGMVAITGGTFEMGASSLCSTPPSGNCGEGDYLSPERVTVTSFVLDTHEVSVGRFRRFWIERAGSSAPSMLRARAVAYRGGQSIGWGDAAQEPVARDTSCNWDASGALDAHPLNCVDWWTAQEFCVWDGYGRGRLPTEAEWEYAARGSADGGLRSGRYYPWGDTEPSPACDRAHWNRCAGDDGRRTRHVGSFVATAALLDMAGSLWEWTADRYARHSCRTSLTDPLCNENASLSAYRVIRGGSWGSTVQAFLRPASRSSVAPAHRNGDGLGFRCARDTP